MCSSFPHITIVSFVWTADLDKCNWGFLRTFSHRCQDPVDLHIMAASRSLLPAWPLRYGGAVEACGWCLCSWAQGWEVEDGGSCESGICPLQSEFTGIWKSGATSFLPMSLDCWAGQVCVEFWAGQGRVHVPPETGTMTTACRLVSAPHWRMGLL